MPRYCAASFVRNNRLGMVNETRISLWSLGTLRAQPRSCRCKLLIQVVLSAPVFDAADY